ncbi:ATP-binding protein [Mycolicibacterium litorale]|uniref:ATP-binding protein n=1 Tax=Mycolicibacterium litorale TaxID=758802 RepID=UPI003CF75BEC
MRARSCQQCGLLLREGARFCDGCGCRITPTLDTAEYKHVTVLFADVVRSMDIARELGAERLREIMSDLVLRCTDVVHDHGGVVSQFTGDGLMAVFGMPYALEDHALRACLAALRIQDEARSLDAEVSGRDGVSVRLRVGLNSGRVVVGAVGSESGPFTTIGEQVGLAQRMESASPAGGVTLSAATARLVEHHAVLSDPESVRIKGTGTPVTVRRLLAVRTDQPATRDRFEPSLVGRDDHLAAIAAALDRASAGRGGVVTLIGPPGIGKTRMVAETVRMAGARSIETFTTFCESHTMAVPFRVVARLQRAVFGTDGRVPDEARALVDSALPGADREDLAFLHDILGIADPAVAAPAVSPEARHRRLTALLRFALVTRKAPAVFVIEDAHWIDEASESLLAELLDAIPGTRSLVLISHRPEYRGALARSSAARAIALSPLPSSDMFALATELLGTDPSVRVLAEEVVQTAAGNPFFAGEIVRDLVERGVLDGARGDYRCRDEHAALAVPPTLQTAIAARIDRLDGPAKSALYAGAVMGMRFGADVLDAVLDDAKESADALTELCAAELIDRAPGTTPEYVFRHPLIRTVAYEAQLRTARARMHHRVAAAIQRDEPQPAEKNAALIAGHLEAAGDLRGALDWHTRAGAWLVHRDRAAAWLSWQRAREVAASLPPHEPDRAALQIATLTRLCSEVWKIGGELDTAGFAQLRRLCEETGDRRSLAIGVAGMVLALTGQHRHRESADLSAELMTLLETLRDPELTCGLLLAVTYAKSEIGAVRDALSLAQNVIDLAGGDLARGAILFGSPLAGATRMRGLYRLCLGIAGWRADADTAIAMAYDLDPTSRVSAIMYKYILSIPLGARRVDQTALDETADALRIAEQAGDHHTLTLAQIARGLVLAHGDGQGRDGVDLLMAARDTARGRGFTMNAVSLIDPALARCKALRGDLDGAIELARAAIAAMTRVGEVLSMGFATTALVVALLNRSGEGDREEAATAVDRLAAIPTDPGFVLHELPLLRLRALVADARGDTDGAAQYLARHRAMAAAANFDPPPD